MKNIYNYSTSSIRLLVAIGLYILVKPAVDNVNYDIFEYKYGHDKKLLTIYMLFFLMCSLTKLLSSLSSHLIAKLQAMANDHGT